MLYPAITDYLEIICHPACFSTLHFIPEKDREGNLVFIPGNMSVVFRVKGEDGQRYALKCFTRDNPYRKNAFRAITEYFIQHRPLPALVLPSYFENEIKTFDLDGNPVTLPVVISKWIEGSTMSETIRQYVYIGNRKGLAELTDRFTEIALRLCKSEYSHGDIKPDNIIVTPTGELKLIDTDSMYTPNNTCRFSPDAGTPAFQHPGRDAVFFNRNTDDYSLLIMLTSLLILEKEPALSDRFSNGENLLFDPRAIAADSCPAYTYAVSHFKKNIILNRLLSALKSRTPSIFGLLGLLELVRCTRSSLTGKPSSGNLQIPALYVGEQGKCGYRFTENDYLTDALFDDAESFGDGLAPVCLDRMWAYIDTAGHIVTPFIYSKAQVFRDGYAAVMQGEKWQILDKTLKVVAETDADHIEPFFDGLAAVRRNGRYGFINCMGETVIESRFELVKPFHSGTAIVRREGRWGIIDRLGDFIVPPMHDSIVRENEGRYKMDFIK